MGTPEPFLNITDTSPDSDGGDGSEGRGINVPGLAGILVFYLLILSVGLYAAWRRKKQGEAGTEEVMLAGRNIGWFVGILTMTATWVGGGYINGSAENIYTSGLFWCQAPFGYSLSLVWNGLFFARQMRDARYVTMLDPLQNCFGKRWGAMLFLPALSGEVLWSASILAALGSTLAVILDLGNTVSIVVSAAIAVFYTLFGGLYSVAYTDVIQLFCIFIGLWVAIPFAIVHPAVGSLSPNVTDWLGSVPSGDEAYHWGLWVDYALLLVLGGVPWQAFYQRVLSSRSSRQAQILSFSGALGCFIMVIPAIIIGVIAKATDWPATEYGKEVVSEDQKLVLPLVMQFLTPGWVAFLGLGAVSAAVMSSADSSVLSASSMFANNIYKIIIRRKASEREVLWVMRGAVIVSGTTACLIAIKGKSISELFYLCSDFVYVMLYPQLTLAVHAATTVNTYGSIVAYFLGFILRILGGEVLLGIPVIIEFPNYVDGVQYFPFRTLCMLVTMATLLAVSVGVRKLHDAGYFPDFLGVFAEDSQPVVVAMNGSGVGGVDNPGVDVTSEKTAHGGGGGRNAMEKKGGKDGAHPQLEMEKF